jgi:integrase
MAVPMTSLRRATNGDWFARKGIPADVRESYHAAFGRSQEERFRRPGSLPVGAAKAELRDWDATITGRIEAIRAAGRGEGRSLTAREAHGLAGEWYNWFTGRHSDEPGDPAAWRSDYERLETAYDRFSPEIDERDDGGSWRDHPNVRRHVRAVLSDLAQASTFLSEKGIVLTPEARENFLDALERHYSAALGLMTRWSDGDYRPDTRPERFPDFNDVPKERPAGLTCWQLFEAWVAERKPGPATVNRWRAVFLALAERFNGRDIATITADEALEWKDTLVTPKRSAQVVNATWLRAARVAFGWALANRKVTENPFDGVAVAEPKRAPKVREREFVEAEWSMILRAALQKPEGKLAPHNAAARRWVPWICAYTGSRPGEVTQLRAEDVEQHPLGFWTMRITPEAGTVKTGQARVVPLHEHLIEQGFVDFVKAAGSGPLFYDPAGKRVLRDDPTNPARPAPVKATAKLAEWVRGLGVTDPNIRPNHAWRHTFKRKAARAKIERRIRFAFCGHESSDVGDEYETPTVEDLAEELKRFPRYELRKALNGAEE